MSSEKIICIKCKKYHEYCVCVVQLQRTNTLIGIKEFKLVEKKLDRILELLEGQISSVSKVEL